MSLLSDRSPRMLQTQQADQQTHTAAEKYRAVLAEHLAGGALLPYRSLRVTELFLKKETGSSQRHNAYRFEEFSSTSSMVAEADYETHPDLFEEQEQVVRVSNLEEEVTESYNEENSKSNPDVLLAFTGAGLATIESQKYSTDNFYLELSPRGPTERPIPVLSRPLQHLFACDGLADMAPHGYPFHPNLGTYEATPSLSHDTLTAASEEAPDDDYEFITSLYPRRSLRATFNTQSSMSGHAKQYTIQEQETLRKKAYILDFLHTSFAAWQATCDQDVEQGVPNTNIRSSLPPAADSRQKRKHVLDSKKAQRPQKDDPESSEGENVNTPSSKKRRTDTAKPNMACPFFKFDAWKYMQCLTRHHSKTTPHIKLHLRRSHRQPIHCPICGALFRVNEELNTHLNERTCVTTPHTYDGITIDQMNDISGRGVSKLKERERWYAIWDILFPGHPRPPSIYVEEEVCEIIQSVQRYLQDRDQDSIANIIMRSGLLNNLGGSDVSAHVASQLQDVLIREMFMGLIRPVLARSHTGGSNLRENAALATPALDVQVEAAATSNREDAEHDEPDRQLWPDTDLDSELLETGEFNQAFLDLCNASDWQSRRRGDEEEPADQE